MRRVWPDPDELTAEQVRAAYAPVDREVPSLRMNMVSSLDGAATVQGRSGGLGNATDQWLMAQLRILADVVLVAAGTIRAEGYGPRLLDDEAVAVRRAAGLPDHPRFAIVSSSLNLDPDLARGARAAGVPELMLITTEQAETGPFGAAAEVVVCGEEGPVDLAAARRALADRGLRQILCEGGPSLFGALAAADLVDEVCLSLSPLLAGGDAGRIVAGAAFSPRRLDLSHVLSDGELLYLRYRCR